MDATIVEWSTEIGAATPPERRVVLGLYPGSGAFSAGPLRTGTFTLTGAEIQYATCGVCVTLREFDAQGGTTARYMATAGTVTLSSISGRLTGTITNATFQHVNIDGSTFTSTPHPDGCATAIDNVAFDVMINGPGGGGGAGGAAGG